MNFRLDRCRRSEQEVLGARSNAKHEVEKIVRWFAVLPKTAASARFVCFIENHGAVFALEQMVAFLGFLENQARGNNCDSERAASDVLWAASSNHVTTRIEPDL